MKKIDGHFLWMGFNSLKATEPLQGDSSSLFTTKSPEVLGSYWIDLEGLKCWVNLGCQGVN